MTSSCLGLAAFLAISSATGWFAQRGGRASGSLPLLTVVCAALAVLFAIAGVGMALGD